MDLVLSFLASWTGAVIGGFFLIVAALCVFYRSLLLDQLGSLYKQCVCILSAWRESLLIWFKTLPTRLFTRRDKYSVEEIFSPMIKFTHDLKFLDKEEALYSLEVIGSGGCGVVYKAEWISCIHKLLAIKQIRHPQIMGEPDLDQVEDTKMLDWRMRQIRSEIKTAGHIRHRNLLPLLAHVARPNCHFLVYEFIKNGSLQHLLEQVRTGAKELPWPARHKIAIGVATGLEYLHMHNSSPIIHRDLKPANILLSDEMEALITDFGLAKVVKEYSTSSHVVGTLGYIAPEYYQSLKFTDKSDVYSFGVILGSLVTGMLPSDLFFQSTNEMCPVKWLRNVVFSEDPYQAIDQKLMGSGHEDQMLLVLRIACFCTADSPRQRPNSKEVRSMLSQIG